MPPLRRRLGALLAALGERAFRLAELVDPLDLPELPPARVDEIRRGLTAPRQGGGVPTLSFSDFTFYAYPWRDHV